MAWITKQVFVSFNSDMTLSAAESALYLYIYIHIIYVLIGFVFINTQLALPERFEKTKSGKSDIALMIGLIFYSIIITIRYYGIFFK